MAGKRIYVSTLRVGEEFPDFLQYTGVMGECSFCSKQFDLSVLINHEESW